MTNSISHNESRAAPPMKTKFFKRALSSWEPLSNPLFRVIWIAALASNVGTWMQNTGAAWVMTSLTRSSLLIALMQTAASLPLFFLSLPAGALADIVDRRKLLIFAQLEMLVAAALLAALTFLGIVNPWVLIALTLLLGIGNALGLPAWLAILPEAVEKKDMIKALALNSVSYNVSIAIGPAIAGFILSKFGAGAVFTLNGLSFIAVIYALASWKREQVLSNLPSEELVTAVKAGFRYLLYSPLLQNLVVRTGIFMLFASAFWALFPSLARFNFQATATGFGLLYGFLGVGAVIGATVVPLFQEKFSIDKGIVFTTCLYALGTAMLVFLRHLAFAYLAMVAIGFAWITTVSTFNVFVQSIVAGWVKARAIGVYMLIFQGALAIGSLLWGALASQFTVTAAFGVSIAGLILTIAGAFLWPLRTEKPLNVEYSFHWPQADVLPDIHHKRGPVLVSLAYEVEPENQRAFLDAIQKLKNMRLRDGAIRWGVFRDTENANRFIENFIVQSWGEHVRQHARPTFTDKELEDAVFKFNKEGEPPVTTHYIAEGYS